MTQQHLLSLWRQKNVSSKFKLLDDGMNIDNWTFEEMI